MDLTEQEAETLIFALRLYQGHVEKWPDLLDNREGEKLLTAKATAELCERLTSNQTEER